MNTLLHKHCAKYIYILPDGLRELMSDISREVLRSQPEQIYTFIADYLDALMITRENARVAARLVDCITEIGATIVELLTRTGITRQQASKAASIIQVAFRRHLELKREFQLKQLNIPKEQEEEYFTNQILRECGISLDKANEAVQIIQEAYRRFRLHERVEHDLLLGMVDWRVAAKSAIYLYRKTGVSMYEANKAATLIKAAYKGYYTRQVMRRLAEGRFAFEDEPFEGIVGDVEPRIVWTEDEDTASEVESEKVQEADVETRSGYGIVQYVLSNIIGSIGHIDVPEAEPSIDIATSPPKQASIQSSIKSDPWDIARQITQTLVVDLPYDDMRTKEDLGSPADVEPDEEAAQIQSLVDYADDDALADQQQVTEPQLDAVSDVMQPEVVETVEMVENEMDKNVAEDTTPINGNNDLVLEENAAEVENIELPTETVLENVQENIENEVVEEAPGADTETSELKTEIAELTDTTVAPTTEGETTE